MPEIPACGPGLLCIFVQADPLERLAKLFESRIGGYESCFQSHRQRRSKAVRVAKLVLVFHLCRAQGLRSIYFDQPDPVQAENLLDCPAAHRRVIAGFKYQRDDNG